MEKKKKSEKKAKAAVVSDDEVAPASEETKSRAWPVADNKVTKDLLDLLNKATF